ncbi:MAG: NYN domain-containing protein [Verrucomicrobia bacterium]|nr:NYN domain-containing protein [Verrucomicrobiota bacterium]
MPAKHLIIDGNNLLHVWQPRQATQPSDFVAARWGLARELDQLAGVLGAALTLVFDGRRGGNDEAYAKSGIQVVFTPTGRTADTHIENLVRGASQPSDILVVTNDHAERDTVESLGAGAMSCGHFLDLMEDRRQTLRTTVVRGRKRAAKATLGDFFPTKEA